MSLRVLVFDLDDTLLDERPGRIAGRNALEECLRERVPDLPHARFDAAYDRARIAFWDDEENHRRGRLDLVAARTQIVCDALREIGAQGAMASAEAASRRYFEAATEAQHLMEGALDVLRLVRARYDRLVLLTNGAEDAQSEKIARFALAGWFDHIQIEGAFGLGKPEPEAFDHAVRKVGGAPRDAMMVGNNYEHDVLGALGAGLRATWVDLHEEGAPAEPPGGLCGTIRHIRQLPELLEETG